jgi:hypothetical protein
MSYNDAVVFVEDRAGDLGAPTPPGTAWWFSPDVTLIAPSPGVAVAGANTVQIRVHAHDEPIMSEKIVAEVYVGTPSLVMSPVADTKRIDPGNLRFRTIDVPAPSRSPTRAGRPPASSGRRRAAPPTRTGSGTAAWSCVRSPRA